MLIAGSTRLAMQNYCTVPTVARHRVWVPIVGCQSMHVAALDNRSGVYKYSKAYAMAFA